MGVHPSRRATLGSMAVIHDPDIRNKIADLHAAGQGRNAIARTLGLADNAVSDTAADLGLTFQSQARQRIARQARIDQAERRRHEIIEQGYQQIQKLQNQMFEPTTIGEFGGRENTWAETELDEPMFRDKLAITQAIRAIAQTIAKLEEKDNGGSKMMVNLVMATAEQLGLSDDGD